MRTSFITDKEEIEKIIRSCDVCYAALNTTDGAPYQIPMNFGYEDNEIILHSGPHGTHLSLIGQDNRISIVMSTNHKLVYQHPSVACSYSMTSQSVVATGVVEFVEDVEEKEKLLIIVMKNYTDNQFNFSAPALKNVKVWRVKIQHLSCKSFGQNFKNKHTTE